MPFQASRFGLRRNIDAAMARRWRLHPALPDAIDIAVVHEENGIVGGSGWQHIAAHPDMDRIVDAFQCAGEAHEGGLCQRSGRVRSDHAEAR